MGWDVRLLKPETVGTDNAEPVWVAGHFDGGTVRVGFIFSPGTGQTREDSEPVGSYFLRQGESLRDILAAARNDVRGWDGLLVYDFPTGERLIATGQTEAHLHITYNYGPVFRGALDENGLEAALDGKWAGDTIVALRQAVSRLGTERHEDYWAATNGNAGYALERLRQWAELNTEGVWQIT